LNLAWAQISCGHFDDFQENIKAILAHPEHTAPSVHLEVQLLRAYGCSANDDSSAVVDIIEPLLQSPISQDAFLLSQLSSLAVSGYVFAGRFAQGREALRIFHRHVPQGQPQHQNYLADAMVGSSYLAEGRVRDALAHLIPFKDKIVLRGKVGPDVLGNLIGTLCEALFRFNSLDEARELSETYSAMVDAAALPIGILSGYMVRARLEYLAGDVPSAFRTLQRLEEVGLQRRLDRLVAWSLYDQFLLTIHTQHLSSREELLHRLSQLADRYADKVQCAESEIPLLYSLTMAENAIYANASSLECIARIDDAEKRARELGRGAILLRLGFLRCISMLSDGKQAPALSLASDLLCRAEELGELRVLADLGTIAHPLARLLGSRERSDAARAVLDVVHLNSQGSREDGISRTRPSGGLVESLTERERAVLEQLGKGNSAKSIGRALDISPTTAKWHLKNAYEKLGASSRDEALRKARQLHLID
jgi:LuxR family maltose regulon positive regulatory protein